MRLRDVGMVMQTPGSNLIPHETVAGNVLFPQTPTRRTRSAARRRAMALLAAVGLDQQASRTAGRLSGGEQQRLAVAVALANGPRLVLADEPTSQLDHRSGPLVTDLLRAASRDLGTTVIVVTHDQHVGQAFGRTVTIEERPDLIKMVMEMYGGTSLPNRAARRAKTAQARRTPSR